ncbi:hypothetical protein GLAREA_00935 [Glarea lozoyensis ATCC 20868]|uniref:Uncharacterized protein n=1 Tax=Glarea lozoyensis (strain ATCC 20868 / MF5171) TaxID=1116229 RepID=S3CVY9_GLAL2|nr:uncharacterized protein GLAREA_00935 [Glarea lozoyensis ATCC 20868]EPE29775.1 hypothetical protein GLAREA_00935 [Glarea lozoyensis ATCC 20868]
MAAGQVRAADVALPPDSGFLGGRGKQRGDWQRRPAQRRKHTGDELKAFSAQTQPFGHLSEKGSLRSEADGVPLRTDVVWAHAWPGVVCKGVQVVKGGGGARCGAWRSWSCEIPLDSLGLVSVLALLLPFGSGARGRCFDHFFQTFFCFTAVVLVLPSTTPPLTHVHTHHHAAPSEKTPGHERPIYNWTCAAAVQSRGLTRPCQMATASDRRPIMAATRIGSAAQTRPPYPNRLTWEGCHAGRI